MDVHSQAQSAVRDEMVRAFDLFDVDRKGFITIDDLTRVVAELGEKLSKEELLEMIAEADQSGNATAVSLGDYQHIMAQTSLGATSHQSRSISTTR